MYLMDGASQIMISKALNESDRMSSCNKGARKHLEGVDSLFNVYEFQTLDDAETGGNPEDFLLRYNIGGINMTAAAFEKLKQEISLQPVERKLHTVWDEENVRMYSGLVPVAHGAFHRLVVREGKVARIDPRDFSFKGWTDHFYYEVCSNSAIYEYVEQSVGAVAGT